MTQRTTAIFLLFVILIGLGLFHFKYQVIGIEESLKATRRSIEQEKERRHVLRAEWKYVTDAQRLQKLAQRHLGFVPIKPTQLVREEDFFKRCLPVDALGDLIDAEDAFSASALS